MRYGKGVYFARDASYSSSTSYARPDRRGVQSMFLCRVVIGEYCLGVKDALAPPPRYGSVLYDTTVNDVQDPAIFVTSSSAQRTVGRVRLPAAKGKKSLSRVHIRRG